MRQCRYAFVSPISTFYIALFSEKVCFVAFSLNNAIYKFDLVDMKAIFNGAQIYIKKLFYFLTFQTSKLPKTVAKKTKKYDIISMLCTPWEISPIWARMPLWCSWDWCLRIELFFDKSFSSPPKSASIHAINRRSSYNWRSELTK